MTKVFIGKIFNPQSFDVFDEYINGYILVKNGKIKAYGNDSSKWRDNIEPNEPIEIIELKKTQFLIPGFVDCHIHGPQFPQIGLGLDLPLLEWLNKYTFPLESKFGNEDFARKAYETVVKTTIRHGTTLASYFGSNHTNGTLILAKEAAKQGQRALVGKVCSNQNCPSYYIESTNDSITETNRFIKEIQDLKSELVNPIVTPRFAVTCSMDLMKKLAEIATLNNLHIQSHISENLDEISLIKDLYGKTYAEVYEEAGLMTNKTIMAHAVHLEDSELDVFLRNKTSIAHCPSSNTNLGSGRCNVHRLLSKGIIVGLGTDVSGGNSPSILNAILKTMDVSHHIRFSKEETSKIITFKNAIYLATLAGAEALSMNDVTGNFTVGKDFDALLIDVNIFPILNIEIPRTEELSPQAQFIEMVQKFIYTGDDRNIVNVFVKGKNIKK